KTLELSGKNPSAQLILPKIELTTTQVIGDKGKVGDKQVIKDDPAKPMDSRVHWTSEQQMSFQITDDLLTGVFSITITNPDGKSKTTIDKAIGVVPPPTLSDVKPPSICDDQSDQVITLTGLDFLVYDGAVPTVTISDGTTTKEYTGTVDPM